MSEDYQNKVMAEIREVGSRVKDLESWRGLQDIRSAVEDQKAVEMNKRFDNIDGNLREIKSGFWKVAWVIILGFLSALISFVIKGGTAIG